MNSQISISSIDTFLSTNKFQLIGKSGNNEYYISPTGTIIVVIKDGSNVWITNTDKVVHFG